MICTERKIAVVGLGYVGLPVACAFSNVRDTIGFDLNFSRIDELSNGLDSTGEIDLEGFNLNRIKFTSQLEDLAESNFFIIAVPTPIDEVNRPDLTAIKMAASSIASIIKAGDVVVFESTVYPGVTEEVCVPILEEVSGLKCGRDFKVGYSPERINPGDKEHSFSKIIKVVSGGDDEALEIIANEYSSVVEAGVHRAPSIKVAEAAKVIENTQRDINIALMNELAMIFDRMDIDTGDVLEAAATKWNFLNFTPGLVGGHCIGVDPYYLTYKAEKVGISPKVILAGRKINDDVGKFIAERTIKAMLKSGHFVSDGIVTVLGLTFKENCTDIRNSRVIDIISELIDYGIRVQIHDPLANAEEVTKVYGLNLSSFEDLKPANAVILSVPHEYYVDFNLENFQDLLIKKGVVIDVKGCLEKSMFFGVDLSYWRF